MHLLADFLQKVQAVTQVDRQVNPHQVTQVEAQALHRVKGLVVSQVSVQLPVQVYRLVIFPVHLLVKPLLEVSSQAVLQVIAQVKVQNRA